jgi:hypothetical protein
VRSPDTDPIHLGARLEEGREPRGIGRCGARSERERPDAPHDEETRERARRLTQGVGLLADRVDECLGAGDDARDRIAVAGQELRGRVQHEVRAVLDRPEQGRAKERVVGDDDAAVVMTQRGDGIEVGTQPRDVDVLKKAPSWPA